MKKRQELISRKNAVQIFAHMEMHVQAFQTQPHWLPDQIIAHFVKIDTHFPSLSTSFGLPGSL